MAGAIVEQVQESQRSKTAVKSIVNAINARDISIDTRTRAD